MSLNIKNPEAHELAKELAALTGESMTEAVLVALRERLEQVRTGGELARTRSLMIRDLGRQIAARLPREARERDWDAELYDAETGLPR